MAVHDYLTLIKFRHHFTFLEVLIPAVLFSSLGLLPTLIQVAVTYMCFAVFLYGGIYTLNDIADAEADRRHPLKQLRPLAARRLTQTSALLFATLLILLGVGGALLLFSTHVVLLYLAVLALTTIYTFVGKRIPLIGLLLNSSTHALRPVLGLLIVHAVHLPMYLFIAYFFFSAGFVAMRWLLLFDFPKNHEPRIPKQRLITITIAAFIGMLAILAADWPVHSVIYLTMAGLYTIFVFGINLSPAIRSFCRARVAR